MSYTAARGGRMRRVCLFTFVAACAPETGSAPDHTPDWRPPDATVSGTVNTATGAPTTLTTSWDCAAPLPEPPGQAILLPIQTEEDIDFDLEGRLVYQSGDAVVGTDARGTTVPLAPGVTGDPSGLHGLSDGRIALVSEDDGALRIVDPATGSSTVVVSGLRLPNGIEVDSSDRIYVTTADQLLRFDPDGDRLDTLGGWSALNGGNGVVLSQDERRLVVALVEDEGTRFLAFDREGKDGWTRARTLFVAPGTYVGIDEDVCGNLVAVEAVGGDVVRFLEDGTAQLLGELPVGGWGYTAARFGPGHHGWERDHLYVTRRGAAVYEFDLGIPGHRHPTTP